jgi:hypothetical protein
MHHVRPGNNYKEMKRLRATGSVPGSATAGRRYTCCVKLDGVQVIQVRFKTSLIKVKVKR